MRTKEFKNIAEKIRSNSTYDVFDWKEFANLTISLTELHSGKETTGHFHGDADEVYVFTSGEGEIQIRDEFFLCKPGSMSLIPRGAFHKVFNRGRLDLKFYSIFEKYGDRK